MFKKINVKEIIHYGAALVAVIGFILMLGTVGGMTRDTIEFGRGCFWTVAGLAMWIGGMVIYDN